MLINLMKKAVRSPGRVPVYLAQLIRQPEFGLLKLRTNGMLAPSVYKRLHMEARTLPDLPFVDIGAATGATTVAIALAFQRSGKTAPVVGVEKCEGGSRDAYGSYSENVALLNRNLRKYGVSDRVHVHTQPLVEGDSSLDGLIGGREMSGFMHDADGRLFRDFDLFYRRTVKGGLIVVDDCPAGRSAEEMLALGYKEKFVRTGVQWSWIEEKGLVEHVERVGDSDTVFARKAGGVEDGSVDFGELKELSDQVDQVLREHGGK